MRSFIKSHRRGSFGNSDSDQPALSLSTGPTLNTTNIPTDSSSSAALSPTSPIQSPQIPRNGSPGRSHLSSPTLSKTNKLQRLFLRNKSSSSNLLGMGLSPVSPRRGSSPPPTIVGTRTHEWGSGPSQDMATKITARTSTSEISSSGSLSSSNESNRLSKPASDEFTDNDFLQLPLNTVLEIPNSILPSHEGSSSEARKKNIHRRAQIVTADSPMSTIQDPQSQQSPTLGDPVKILPSLDSSLFDKLNEDLDFNLELDFDSGSDLPSRTSGVPLGLAPAAEILASPSTIRDNKGNYDDDDTANKTIGGIDNSPVPPIYDTMITPIETPPITETVGKVITTDNEDSSSSHESEFSFERDGVAGRNTSIRYYKNPQDAPEGDGEGGQQTVREQGFYVNDFMEEDEFDDDMNYFDENDDDYNDDEELFNKKYFSDEEEDQERVEPVSSRMNTLTISTRETHEPVPDLSITKTPLISPPNTGDDLSKMGISKYQEQPESDHSLTFFEEYNPLRPKRSLKYHQLPVSYEHEFSERRYSWLSDDENTSNRGSQSYDSLLDEINNIPDDFDYDDDKQHSTPNRIGGKTLNSSLKRNQINVLEITPQNTKFHTNDKTVTLFHRSSSSSSRSDPQRTPSTTTSALQEQYEDISTIRPLVSSTPTKDQGFTYMTPNNSFTTPHPLFKTERDVELSPISEGSFIDDSYVG